MRELIKITEHEGRQAVSARELYERLGLNKAVFSRWAKMNIVDNPFAFQSEDWVGFNIMLNGNDCQDYALTIDFAKRLAMQAKTEKGERIRQYFIECEKALQKVQQPVSILDLMEMSVQQLKAQDQRLAAVENTVQLLTAKVTDVNTDYFTLAGYYSFKRRRYDLTKKEECQKGKDLTRVSRKNGYRVGQVPSTQWGHVNTYHIDILEGMLGF